MFIFALVNVLLTIFVLVCHHNPSDKSLSKVMKSMTSCVSKIVCWKSSCCKRSKSSVNNSKVDISPVMEFKGASIADEMVDDTVEEYGVDKSDLSWQEAALIWDRFFLWTSILVVSSVTIAVVAILTSYSLS